MADGPVSPAWPRATPRSGDVRSLLLRAWLEPGVPPCIRARVVEIGPDLGERPMVVTASVDEACRAVRNWRETLLAGGIRDNGDGTMTQRG
jgi:hypothetical protein